MGIKRVALTAVLSAAAPGSVGAFVAPHGLGSGKRITSWPRPSHHFASRRECPEPEEYSSSRPDPEGEREVDDDLLELRPPPINWERRSLLFDESGRGDDVASASAAADRKALEKTIRRASGAANSASLALWRGATMALPGIVTGCRERGNDADAAAEEVADGAVAAGRLYNVLFVRVPTIVAGLIYARNLYEGHPLVVDVGGGPFEVPPPAVLATLWAILSF